MHYIKTKDVGYNRSLVFTVQMPAAMENHSDAVIAALQQNSAIAAVSTANQNINEVTRSSGGFGIPGRSDIDLLFNDLEIAPGFLSAMQMKLTQGAGFSGTPADSSGFLLNQTAVRVLNLQHPIGQQVIYQGRKGTVIGVVRDFNFQNLKEKIAPIVIYSRPGANGKHGSVLYVRAKKAALQPAISSTEAIFKQYAGELPFKYDFLDKNFNSAYDSFSRSLSLLNIFSLVAVLISGMGLFGLATYTAEVKTKEIGIRKVMGASKKDIIELISRDFVLLVLLATLIALPVGSWMMHRWLTYFAYKITIGPWVFVIVILFMMLITWLIIGFKALQAASKNPVKSLKTE
ncbi:ABC transporter permease [Arachidicoccus ginsenosidivorans]|nr:FtsX-like permease family protein [Arachidicoccus ginsenosidivorans]